MWSVEFLLLLYFGYVVFYTLIFSLAGLFYRRPASVASAVLHRFRIFIPSYKEDAVILEVARKSLVQDYPASHYRVTVIADSLQPATVAELRRLPIDVVEVKFDSSTKVKSLNTALQSVPEADMAVILDADNVMEPDFLVQINSILSANVRVVQGQRKPKNQNNSLALLDGVSEAINNHIYRQGTVALGLSASIVGSGIAFDYRVLKTKLATMSSVGGFDRELEVLLLQDGIRVYYLRDAVIFDEKVSQTQAFQNQRRRWISSQYYYLRKYFSRGVRELLKGNFMFFNSAVLRNIQLPRLINLGLLTILTGGLFFLRHVLFFSYDYWLALFVLQAVAMLIAIPREFWTPRLAAAVFELPSIFFRMMMLLFKLKGANKKFIHTPHGVTNESA